MESEFAVESCVRGTTSTKSLGEELPCTHAVAVMRRRTIVRATVRKMSAARSLFLADQLLACYFSPISCLLAIFQRQRYCSIMLARDFERSSVATRPRPHARRKYWRNLIWRCVHNPPNRQIKFPAKFSGHTVG